MTQMKFIGLDVPQGDGRRRGMRWRSPLLWNDPQHAGRHSPSFDRLSGSGAGLHFCYEAGGCGYGIYRQLQQGSSLFLLKHRAEHIPGVGRSQRPRKRAILVEAAWSYRLPAREEKRYRIRLEGLPEEVSVIAWMAQARLCQRCRRLAAAGKPQAKVITAIAREMAGSIWDVSQHLQPARPSLMDAADPNNPGTVLNIPTDRRAAISRHYGKSSDSVGASSAYPRSQSEEAP